jgi:hypothetical protein
VDSYVALYKGKKARSKEERITGDVVLKLLNMIQTQHTTILIFQMILVQMFNDDILGFSSLRLFSYGGAS